MRHSNHEKLAIRLSEILIQLNNGERLDVHELCRRYKVSLRTIKRDLDIRFANLDYSEDGPRYYRLNKIKQGHLNENEIQRFARFASVQHLFPEIDRNFFQKQLEQSIKVKGFQYENIKNKQKEFDALNQAIKEQRRIQFNYQKVSSSECKQYQLEPYRLLNKNGVWYLIGVEQGRPKTYCFTQIKNLEILAEHFETNPKILENILSSDSLYHGNQLPEIIIQIKAEAAGYFKRRALLPNQEIIRELEDGGLIIACKNINPSEIIPIVQYWIPHAYIISPSELQDRIIHKLQNYIKNPNARNML